MIDVAFISDLHLHPEDTAIEERFDQFVEWAKHSISQLYILGDFFYAWVGDDSIDDWSRKIAKQIRSLVDAGIPVYFMHGNRDFLLGKRFAELAGWIQITEPKVIHLDDKEILLVHGDSYCTKDQNHQRFRKLTRNQLFPLLFGMLPLRFRNKLVEKVRQKSLMNHSLTAEQMDVVAEDVIKHMNQHSVIYLIHGHTHKPGVTTYESGTNILTRYVLSDWDDTPTFLCYNKTKGLHFMQI